MDFTTSTATRPGVTKGTMRTPPMANMTHMETVTIHMGQARAPATTREIEATDTRSTTPMTRRWLANNMRTATIIMAAVMVSTIIMEILAPIRMLIMDTISTAN